MAESGTHHNYVLLNPRDVESYIRGLCDAYNETPLHADRFSPATIDHVCATLAPVIAKRDSCMRKAADADFAAHNPETIEFQAEILGRKFYVFDPKDCALDIAIIKAAKLIQAMIDTRAAFNQLGGAPEVTAAYLRPDFLYTALAVPQGRDKTVIIERETAPAAPPVNEEPKGEPAVQLPVALSQKPALGPVEISMQLDDGWRIERFYSLGKLEEVNAALGDALTIDRELMLDAHSLYYAAVDDNGMPRALLAVNAAADRITMCRSARDTLPDAESSRRILQFIKYRNMEVDENAAQTGFWLAEPKRFVALTDIPPGTIGRETLRIDGLKQAFNLTNIVEMNADLLVRHSPGFISLGDLRLSTWNIRINDCENFTDMGRLESMVNASRYTNLDLEGCKNLTSLGGVRRIEGSLNIKGTGVREISRNLTHVYGGIETDAGNFNMLNKLGRARNAVARHAAAQQKLLPPPSYGGPQ